MPIPKSCGLKQPFLIFMDSLGQEFRQSRARMVFCFTLSETSAESSQGWGLESITHGSCGWGSLLADGFSFSLGSLSTWVSLGFLTAWWQDAKVKNPERQRARQKPHQLLWPIIPNYATHSIHLGSHKIPSSLKRKRNRYCLLMGRSKVLELPEGLGILLQPFVNGVCWLWAPLEGWSGWLFSGKHWF